MSLSCECDTDHDWFYDSPDDYSTLETSRRKRCISCNNLIDLGAVCVAFPSYRFARDDVEERIYGEEEEIYTATKYMCEECGDLYFSLFELGFCISIGDESMEQLISCYRSEYIEI